MVPGMGAALPGRSDDDRSDDGLVPETVEEALAGLSGTPKTLPPKLFYDEEGCRLFARITELPEYYLTRTEIALLKDVGPRLPSLLSADLTPAGLAIVEYGAGSEDKVSQLLSALPFARAYVPIDVAADALRGLASRLRRRFPALRIYAVAMDFTEPFALPKGVGSATRLGFFPGSTIGNLAPAAAAAFLRQTRATLGTRSFFLVGVDLRKAASRLLPAYDDAEGVTAAFNRNLLHRLNREAGADFDPADFEHRAVWNDRESRIEMHLVSRTAQTVLVGGQAIQFARGETIHTESSYKYTVDGFRDLAVRGGWLPTQVWTDPESLFSLHLLRSEA
jgi:L-histidine Nalpha-methyltransferase